MSTLNSRAFDAAMDEIAQRSRKRLYQTDFAAWQWDVLGERTYKKMEEIGNDVLLADKPRTMVKSANGSAKTFQAARWGMWWCTAFPPEESLAIFTAPTLKQVEIGVIAYIKSCYGHVKRSALASGKPMPWPGWISEQNEWRYSTDGGNAVLAFGRVPGASDAVSTFQGARKPGGRNFIILDEAGGVSPDIFTAIEALMTGGDSRMAGIGNPDRRDTDFYRTFTDERQAAEFNLHTISAYDLPTMTGEVVYPNDPAKEAMMLKGLTSRAWIEHKERAWRSANGTPDARFLAKVLGQFPGETDNSFFPEEDVTKSRDNDIEPAEGCKTVMGVDLAAKGEDESVVYVNRGGHVRQFARTIKYDDGGEERETSGVWAKEDEVTSARRVHAIAMHLGAEEVRVDAAGLGGGIATMLYRLKEFDDKCYTVVRVVGSEKSSDKDRWTNRRAEDHDNLKRAMHDGLIDIDENDTVLRDELLIITYELGKRGEVVITKKRDMKSALGGSPDRLDALIYATVDTSPLLDNPLGHLNKGDKVSLSPWDLMQASRGGPGYPI